MLQMAGFQIDQVIASTVMAKRTDFYTPIKLKKKFCCVKVRAIFLN
jgi:hypothetical protein